MKDRFWEENAEAWAKVIASNTIASRAITGPAILEEISKLGARSIIDVGCGEGWIAPHATALGIDYFGIDGSTGLIAKARQRGVGGFEAVDYAELAQGAWTSPRRFDAAVFNFALLNDEISPVLRSIASLMTPDGTILIQTLHPCFALPAYRDGWNTEDFKAMAVPFQGTMPWFGRTLSSWSETIETSGLRIERMREPAAPGANPSSLILVLKRRT